MTVSEQLLTLLLSSSKGGDLPVITDLKNTDKVIVFDVENKLVSTILKDDLGISGSIGSSYKIPITIDFNEQIKYALTSKPDNIDLSIGRVKQYEGVDYTYNSLTGVLDITNTSVGASIKTNTLIDARGFNNSLSKKESLIISSEGQSVFVVIEKPKNIDLSLNRTVLIEDVDYTYNNTTGKLVITNSSLVSSISLNSILKARKFY